MTRELIGFLMVMIVVVIAALVAIGYRKKRLSESSTIEPFSEATDCNGIECLYVSTVFYDNPLRRLLAHGMGPRGKAAVAVGVDGISVCRQGERGFQISKTSLIGIERSSATIDRAVEPGGLTSIVWRHSGEQFVTNLRFQSREEREVFENEVMV